MQQPSTSLARTSAIGTPTNRQQECTRMYASVTVCISDNRGDLQTKLKVFVLAELVREVFRNVFHMKVRLLALTIPANMRIFINTSLLLSQTTIPPTSFTLT